MNIKGKKLSYIIILIIVCILVLVAYGMPMGIILKYLNNYSISSSDKITAIYTIFVGFLGILGSIIGGMVALIIYNKGKNDEYIEKETSALNLLFNLLEYTIRETDFTVSYITRTYIDYYEREYGVEVVYIKTKDAYYRLPDILEGLINKYNCLQDELYLEAYEDAVLNAGKDNRINLNEIEIEDIEESELEIFEVPIENKDKFIDIAKILGKLYSGKTLVYDENWYNYLKYIPGDNRSSKIEDTKVIINWITCLKKSQLKESIEQLEDLYKSLNNTSKSENLGTILKKISYIEEIILDEIRIFIDSRDDAIDILLKHFNPNEMDMWIYYKSSEKYLKESIDERL